MSALSAENVLNWTMHRFLYYVGMSERIVQGSCVYLCACAGMYVCGGMSACSSAS